MSNGLQPLLWLFVVEQVITMRIVMVLLASILVMAMASGQGREVPFQVIDRGTNSGVKEVGVKAIRTARAFEELLEGMLGAEKTQRLLKQVQWDTEQVVLIYGGEHPTGGFSIDVKRIVSVDRQQYEIEAKLKKPAPGQIVTQAFTTPFTMIKMRKEVGALSVKLD